MVKTVVYSATFLVTMAIGVIAFLSKGFRDMGDPWTSLPMQVFWACALFAVIVEPILLNAAMAKCLAHVSTTESIVRGLAAGALAVVVAIVVLSTSLRLVVGYISCLAIAVCGVVVGSKR